MWKAALSWLQFFERVKHIYCSLKMVRHVTCQEESMYYSILANNIATKSSAVLFLFCACSIYLIIFSPQVI